MWLQRDQRMSKIAPKEITKESARRFLILRQGFLQGKGGKEGTLEAIRHLECVQVDPINVVHRNQHLVLHNRVKDYKTSYLEELLYNDRRVFEYWCNEKSIIPIEDLRYFSYRMKNSSKFQSPYYDHIKAKRKELRVPIAKVLSETESHGPISSQELEQNGEFKGRVATDVLNLLWDCGDLMIHHVEGNRRYYDLAEHILSSSTKIEVPTREEYEQFMIRKYMRAYGLVDTRDWRFGWLPMKTLPRKSIVNDMIRSNELCPMKIEGVEQEYYVLKELLDLLGDSDTPIDEKVYFIAPLDNLLWNRKVISDIFDFDYSWEVYKIPEKRIHGYYVMPVLCGTHLVGRLDPKLDRQNEKMIINSLSIAEKYVSRSFINELIMSLRRFSEFHDVSQVSIQKTQPEELKTTLTRELN
jgi:uncharacterized protein YcaQ